MRAFSSFLRKQILILLFYFLVTIVITFPLITSLSTRYIGGDTGDAYEMTRNIWWIKHAFQTGQPLVFQPALGYPDGFLGITIWAHWLQFFPGWLFAFLMPLATAYNISILLTMILNGWAMYWLAYNLLHKGSHHAPALIAGLVFMAFPAFQGHLFESHAGLIVQWPVPLYIYALLNWIKTSRRRYLLLSILFFFLSAGGHTFQTVYVLLPITGMFLFWQIWHKDRTGALRVIIAGALSSIVYLIFLSPVIGETLQTTAYFESGGAVRYSADLLGIVSPSFEHPLFGSILEYPRRVLGINLGEGTAYIGIIVGFLIIIGLFSKREARFWFAMGIVLWILSLGPLLKIHDTPATFTIDQYETLIPLPFAFLQELPGFNLARTPGRYNLALAIPVAILAGYGFATLRALYQQSGATQRYGLIALLIVAILWEYQFFWPIPTSPAAIPQSVIDLRKRDDIQAVFNIPWENLLAAKDALHLQVGHQKPLIAGQVTRRTPVNPAKLNVLQDTLDLNLLDQTGADLIIFHKTRQSNITIADISEKIGNPFYEDEKIAMYEVPEPIHGDETLFASTISGETESITTQSAIYSIYVDEPGWVDISGQFIADQRDVTLLLNNNPLHTWRVNRRNDFVISIPIPVRGYSTVSFALDPPCPIATHETLKCQSLRLIPFEIEKFVIGPIYDPVKFANGVELAAAFFPEDLGNRLTVRLWWRLDEGRRQEDIRFVHIIDENNRLVAQNDESFGNRPPDSQWSEQIRIPIGNLPAGQYKVLAGWYQLPSQIRLNILSDVPGAENNTVELGAFEIRGQ